MATILIAEDERDIRDLITFTLNFAGHQVISASNGEEAVQKALEIIPDLVGDTTFANILILIGVIRVTQRFRNNSAEASPFPRREFPSPERRRYRYAIF